MADLLKFAAVFTQSGSRTVADGLLSLAASAILADMRRRIEASEIPASAVDVGALLIPQLPEAE